MKKTGKQIQILVVCAVVLTVVVPVGEKFLRPASGEDKIPITCEIEPAGIDYATHSLLTEVTVTLPDKEPQSGLLLTAGEESLEFPLTETASNEFCGVLSVPLDLKPQDGFRLYLIREKLGEALIQDPLRRWDNIAFLLPVRLRKYMTVVPKFQTGNLRDGVLTTRAEDIHLEGAEDGCCAVELRAYRNGILAQTAAAAWDEETGLYHTEDLELFCQWGDEVRLAIGCRDGQGLDYEFTHGRWQITDGGGLKKLPDLKMDDYPILTWD